MTERKENAVTDTRITLPYFYRGSDRHILIDLSEITLGSNQFAFPLYYSLNLVRGTTWDFFLRALDIIIEVKIKCKRQT